MARVLIPLPARDFDPSEAAVSWQVLSNAGHIVTIATLVYSVANAMSRPGFKEVFR